MNWGGGVSGDWGSGGGEGSGWGRSAETSGDMKTANAVMCDEDSDRVTHSSCDILESQGL